MRTVKNKLFLIAVVFLSLCIFLCGCNRENPSIYETTEEIFSETLEDNVSSVSEESVCETSSAYTPPNDTYEVKKEVILAEEETKAETSETTEHSVSVQMPETTEKAKALTCSLTINCDTVHENLDKLDKAKYNLIPDNGIIFSSENLEFTEGETVFDLLIRTMKQHKIHMEFEYTPDFNSYYIEGIGNLYEFDCGDTSGWIYKVNGKPAVISCSQYTIKAGDVIEWIYTCGF